MGLWMVISGGRLRIRSYSAVHCVCSYTTTTTNLLRSFIMHLQICMITRTCTCMYSTYTTVHVHVHVHIRVHVCKCTYPLNSIVFSHMSAHAHTCTCTGVSDVAALP